MCTSLVSCSVRLYRPLTLVKLRHDIATTHIFVVENLQKFEEIMTKHYLLKKISELGFHLLVLSIVGELLRCNDYFSYINEL